MSKFEIYTDKKGETRFRYRARNGEIVFSSEGYAAKASAKKAIASIKKNVPGAVVVEEAAPPVKKPVAKTAANKMATTTKTSKTAAKKTSKSKATAKPKASPAP